MVAQTKPPLCTRSSINCLTAKAIILLPASNGLSAPRRVSGPVTEHTTYVRLYAGRSMQVKLLRTRGDIQHPECPPRQEKPFLVPRRPPEANPRWSIQAGIDLAAGFVRPPAHWPCQCQCRQRGLSSTCPLLDTTGRIAIIQRLTVELMSHLKVAAVLWALCRASSRSPPDKLPHLEFWSPGPFLGRR